MLSVKIEVFFDFLGDYPAGVLFKEISYLIDFAKPSIAKRRR
jgi:hypothetical protein